MGPEKNEHNELHAESSILYSPCCAEITIKYPQDEHDKSSYVWRKIVMLKKDTHQRAGDLGGS
jgi:hypothetical protein